MVKKKDLAYFRVKFHLSTIFKRGGGTSLSKFLRWSPQFTSPGWNLTVTSFPKRSSVAHTF